MKWENEPCQRCGGRGYTMKKQTHPRGGLIEVREQCGCSVASADDLGLKPNTRIKQIIKNINPVLS
ncbi:MAG: hypothetical protein HOE64_17095 [Nitrospina sp.]|jgi:hypothetical protein|nr:hypothetical protein [Nitrospina sp.]